MGSWKNLDLGANDIDLYYADADCLKEPNAEPICDSPMLASLFTLNLRVACTATD